MFTVELYARIRRAVMVDGLSRREAAKRFGVHRNTIAKMLQFSIPPGYSHLLGRHGAGVRPTGKSSAEILEMVRRAGSLTGLYAQNL